MTDREYKNIRRVYGPNHDYKKEDIPTYIRNRDLQEEGLQEAEAEQRLKEEAEESLEAEDFSRRADIDAEEAKHL